MNDPSDLVGNRTDLLYKPERQTVARSQLSAFIAYCQEQTGLRFATYPEFESFAKSQYRSFWGLFLNWSQIICQGSKRPVCTDGGCETAEFFPNLRINYSQNLLSGKAGNLIGIHGDGSSMTIPRRDLRDQVIRLAHQLRHLGVEPGDRVVAVARNNVEVVIAALATAAIGAVFSSVAHDMGVATALARFQQLAPKVLFASFATKPWDGCGTPLGARINEIVTGLPTLRAVVVLDRITPGRQQYRFADLVREGPTEFDWPQFDFNHPLFIMFSSGTTGLPKCIVHGAGGTLLEHVKEHRLHGDLTQNDRLMFQTSCGWMMWNWQLSALACNADIIVYDGPLRGPGTMWEIVATHKVTVFGTSPSYIQFAQTTGYAPVGLNFTPLRSILSTGSILYANQFDWLVHSVKRVPIQSISGGTDIIGCFVLGNPNLPVYRGEAQCTSLGLDVRSTPPGAQIGELVCVNPFPSRPTGFFGDDDGTRYHEAYFTANYGVWTHGDLLELTEHGGAIMHGRSDGILNIRGVRIGPAEIYRILREVPDILDAMAVEQHYPNEPGGARLILLVVLRDEATLDTALIRYIRTLLAEQGHATMVPSAIVQVPEVPVTFNGKPSEAAARDAVNNRPIKNLSALRNPDCLNGLKERIEQPDIDVPAMIDSTDLERSLCDLARKYLRVPVHPTDNFLALGGDSIAILSFLLDVTEKVPSHVPFQRLTGVSTVKELVRALRTGNAHVTVTINAPDIRPAEYEDKTEVCKLLREGYGSDAQWRRIFDHPWQAPGVPRGYVLTYAGKIVGFIGLICAVREINGQIGLVANLTSWYVKPAYRGWSNALLAAAVEAQDITYTSLTPGKAAMRVLRAMGFEIMDRAKWYSPPGTHLTTLRKTRFSIVLNPTHIGGDQQRILSDQAPYEGLPVMMIDDEEALIIVRRRQLRGSRLLPYSEVLYCSAPAVLRRHVEAVKLEVMREQKTLGLLFGEHMRCGGVRIPDPTLFRSSSFAAHELDKLYSELVLLPI